LVKDLPIIERKQRDAAFVLADCKAWLDGLSDNVVFEFAPPCKPDDDLTLEVVRQRIHDATDEIKQLRAMPTPAPDIEKKIKGYVSALARPKIGGIGAGQQLRVDWPNRDPIALLAFLHPNEMVAALTGEVVRQENVMPLPERKKRIEDLELTIGVLQRRAVGLGIDLCSSDFWRQRNAPKQACRLGEHYAEMGQSNATRCNRQ
jgi:hypothetical protein